MSEAAADIRRVLTIVFRSVQSLPRADLERTLSFDMEWLEPHEAEKAVEQLVNAGWLKEKSGELTAAVTLGDIDVPFGWFPRPSRLLQPVGPDDMEFPQSESRASTSTPVASPSPPAVDVREPSTNNDPRAALTRRVKGFIVRQSGLTAEELQRRADRKIAAFHLITPWLAYALVAREQGLEMDDIVQALAVV